MNIAPRYEKTKTGILYPLEFYELNFKPKRLFFVSNVETGEIRGKHAHIECEQYIVCIHGQIEIYTFDGYMTNIKTLNVGDTKYIPKMIWNEVKYMTGNDILLCLCSHPYDKNDYINDINDYTNLIKQI